MAFEQEWLRVLWHITNLRSPVRAPQTVGVPNAHTYKYQKADVTHHMSSLALDLSRLRDIKCHESHVVTRTSCIHNISRTSLST